MNWRTISKWYLNFNNLIQSNLNLKFFVIKWRRKIFQIHFLFIILNIYISYYLYNSVPIFIPFIAPFLIRFFHLAQRSLLPDTEIYVFHRWKSAREYGLLETRCPSPRYLPSYPDECLWSLHHNRSSALAPSKWITVADYFFFFPLPPQNCASKTGLKLMRRGRGRWTVSARLTALYYTSASLFPRFHSGLKNFLLARHWINCFSSQRSLNNLRVYVGSWLNAKVKMVVWEIYYDQDYTTY